MTFIIILSVCNVPLLVTFIVKMRKNFKQKLYEFCYSCFKIYRGLLTNSLNNLDRCLGCTKFIKLPVLNLKLPLKYLK